MTRTGCFQVARFGGHLFVNYGTKAAPVAGCFSCGCTPTDPTPEAVQVPR